jgi:hypothetical protein
LFWFWFWTSGSASQKVKVPVPFPVPQHRCTAHWSSFDFRKTYVFRNSSVARLNLCKDNATVGLLLTGQGLNLRVSYIYWGEKKKNKTILLVFFSSKHQFLGSGFSWILGRKERRYLTTASSPTDPRLIP